MNNNNNNNNDDNNNNNNNDNDNNNNNNNNHNKLLLIDVAEATPGCGVPAWDSIASSSSWHIRVNESPIQKSP